MFHVALFATTLVVVQQLDRTDRFFSFCSFGFVILAGMTFNIAGGFTTPSGGYVFFYAMLAVIVGLTWKAVLGEPGQSNLFEPRLTIEVFLGGMFAMLLSVILSRRLTRNARCLAISPISAISRARPPAASSSASSSIS